jgi:hypothetical protein
MIRLDVQIIRVYQRVNPVSHHFSMVPGTFVWRFRTIKKHGGLRVSLLAKLETLNIPVLSSLYVL